jgi:hypothetical protein
MQGSPLEETGLVEQQADDDHGDEGGSGIPDNGPHQGNVAERDHTCQQRQRAPKEALQPTPSPLGCQMTRTMVAMKYQVERSALR